MKKIFGIVVVFVSIFMSCYKPDFFPAYEKATKLYEQKKYSDAFPIMFGLAKKGFAPAQNMIGIVYKKGLGEVRSEKEAVKWFFLAAEKGDELGQVNLGDMYRDGGIEIKKDFAKAIHFYNDAIKENQSAIGMYNLGCMYEKGNGVPKSKEKAMILYIKSAEQCFGLALMKLKKNYKLETNKIEVKIHHETNTMQEDFSDSAQLIMERCVRPKSQREILYRVN